MCGHVRCGGEESSKKFHVQLKLLRKSEDESLSNRLIVTMRCSSAENDAVLKDKVLLGLADLDLKFGEGKIFGNFEADFSCVDGENVFVVTISFQEWLGGLVTGILHAVSVEQVDVSVSGGTANTYAISHSLKFSKLLFELLAEHVPIDQTLLQWLCSLESQDLNLQFDRLSDLMQTPALQFILSLIAPDYVFNLLLAGEDIDTIIRAVHDELRTKNEKVFRYIQLMASFEELRKIEIHFGEDLFLLEVDFPGLLRLFQNDSSVGETKKFQLDSFYRSDYLETQDGTSSKPKEESTTTAEGAFEPSSNNNSEAIAVNEDATGITELALPKDATENVIEPLQPAPEVIVTAARPEIYRGQVFEISLSELYAKSGNAIPQFWVLIFQILNKPLFLSEEGVLRVPGNHETIFHLQQQIDAGEYDTVAATRIACEDAASVLKLYIRKLPESIVSADLESIVSIEFHEKDPLLFTDEQLAKFDELLNSMDVAHYCFLYLLSEYLSNITKLCARNLMNMNNIKRVLAPTLVHGVLVLEICTLNFSRLFRNEERIKIVGRESHLSKLNDELSRRLLRYLAIDDICDLGRASQFWKGLLSPQDIWKSISIYNNYIPEDSESQAELFCWKQYCTKRYSEAEFRLKGYKFYPLSRDCYERVQITVSDLVLSFVGESGVGKSNIVNQFVNRQFKETFEPTIEDVYQKTVTVSDCSVDVTIIDTAGLPQDLPKKQLQHKTHCYVLVYSSTSLDSYKLLVERLQRLKADKATSDAAFVLVGTHADNFASQAITRKEAKAFARRESLPFFEISGLYWNSVIDDIFHTCIKEYCYFRKISPPVVVTETKVSEPVQQVPIAPVQPVQEPQPLAEEESTCAIQ